MRVIENVAVSLAEMIRTAPRPSERTDAQQGAIIRARAALNEYNGIICKSCRVAVDEAEQMVGG